MSTATKRRVIHSLLMGGVLSGVMSFVFTYLSSPFSIDPLGTWVERFWKSAPLVVPLLYFFTPYFENVSAMLAPERPEEGEKQYD